MSFWVAGAVVVGTGVSAYSSKKAGEQAAEGQKKGMDQSLSITNQARDDVMRLFQQSSQQSALARNQALDFYKQNAVKRIAPYQAGNMAAQQAIGQGATQANNAILGLPVDMSFANQPQQIQADYSGIGMANIPQAAAQSQQAAPQQAQTPNIGQPPINQGSKVRDYVLGRLLK